MGVVGKFEACPATEIFKRELLLVPPKGLPVEGDACGRK